MAFDVRRLVELWVGEQCHAGRGQRGQPHDWCIRALQDRESDASRAPATPRAVEGLLLLVADKNVGVHGSFRGCRPSRGITDR